jgi:hypothetical protein
MLHSNILFNKALVWETFPMQAPFLQLPSAFSG